ncbi:MAG: GNAT family N-acetyltransferase [Halobacillus sp.]|uniref:GNAT family N-acetyltransferase n=1 Tax=Halobacillus sp. TaxID=56800 RepID=UPI003BB1BAE7
MSKAIQNDQGRFYIGDQGNPDAHLDFEEHGDTMKILSTVVVPSERENGLGSDLVDHAVNYARENKLVIEPVCSFAHEVIKDTPEYHVVWKK